MSGFGGVASNALVLNNDATQQALTGSGANTSETILKTVTIPPLTENSTIDIDALFSWTNSANTKTFRIRLGGIGGAVVFQSGVTTNQQQQQKVIVRNTATNAQKFFNNATGVGYGVSSAAINTASINTAAGTTLVFTGQLDAAAAAAGDSVRYEASTVQVIL
jgi:hypothetical protein